MSSQEATRHGMAVKVLNGTTGSRQPTFLWSGGVCPLFKPSAPTWHPDVCACGHLVWRVFESARAGGIVQQEGWT
jgi:hypothetical protein